MADINKGKLNRKLFSYGRFDMHDNKQLFPYLKSYVGYIVFHHSVLYIANKLTSVIPLMY